MSKMIEDPPSCAEVERDETRGREQRQIILIGQNGLLVVDIQVLIQDSEVVVWHGS
jgi:hypothetical protein